MFLRREIRVQRPSRYPGRMDPADAPPSIPAPHPRACPPRRRRRRPRRVAAVPRRRHRRDRRRHALGPHHAGPALAGRRPQRLAAEPRVPAGVPPVRGAGEVAAVLVTTCTAKLHHEETYDCGVETFTRREEYACGTERKCAKVRRTRQAAGPRRPGVRRGPRKCTRDILEERPKVCTRPVHADWCDYLTQEWVPVRSEKIEGDAHLEPALPGAARRRRLRAHRAQRLLHADLRRTRAVSTPPSSRARVRPVEPGRPCRPAHRDRRRRAQLRPTDRGAALPASHAPRRSAATLSLRRRDRRQRPQPPILQLHAARAYDGPMRLHRLLALSLL
jgi:hypothetical protein